MLALLVAMGAIAWPMFDRGFDGIRLQNAAEQVQADLTHARVTAISTGQPQAFRCEPNSGQYSVSALPDDGSGTDSSGGSTASTGASASPGAGSSSSGSSGGASTGCYQRALPDGMVFSTVQRTADTRSSSADEQLAASGGSSDLPPLLFYTDGTSSDGSVTLSNNKGKSISIVLRALTGSAHLGELFATGSPDPAQAGTTQPTGVSQ